MRKTNYSSGFKQLFDPETVGTFLLGGIGLSVLGNAVYGALSAWLGTGVGGFTLIIAGSFLVIVAAALTLRYLGTRNAAVAMRPYQIVPAKRRGLIMLVSRKETALKAIEWHAGTLETCWLLCTKESDEVGAALESTFTKHGVVFRKLRVVDEYSVTEVRDHVELIYNTLPAGMDATDIIFDFTGLTKCASVGGVLACLEPDRAIQHVPAPFDKGLNAISPADPVEIQLSWSSLPVRRRKKRATAGQTNLAP